MNTEFPRPDPSQPLSEPLEGTSVKKVRSMVDRYFKSGSEATQCLCYCFAVYLYYRGSEQEARSYAARALVLAEKIFGADHEETSRCTDLMRLFEAPLAGAESIASI